MNRNLNTCILYSCLFMGIWYKTARLSKVGITASTYVYYLPSGMECFNIVLKSGFGHTITYHLPISSTPRMYQEISLYLFSTANFLSPTFLIILFSYIKKNFGKISSKLTNISSDFDYLARQ